VGSQSLVVPDILSFPAPRSEFCCYIRNARVHRTQYSSILSGIAPRSVFTRPVHAVGVICDVLKRIYSIYESDPEGVIDASVCDALNSAHVSFFSGIAGRDVLAAFDFARLSFVSFSASKFSARFSALST